MSPEKEESVPEPNAASTETTGESASLFPGMEIPEEIESLARKLKTAEISRKQHAAIEKECRENLCAIMDSKDLHRFQVDIDGIDYEFELEEKSRVKSKKLHEDD